MSKEYKYNNSTARFYDIIYDKLLNKSGYEFYINEIKNCNGAVLEAGVGTGRIFVPALNLGADIYGIDQSELMLKELKEKISEENFYRITQQDVREFSINKKFSLIISPFRVFGHLLEIEDQLKALNKIYDHLEPGGKFIFDLFVPDLEKLNMERNNNIEFDGEYEPGKKLQRYVTVKHNYINQILEVTFKLVWDENGKSNSEECLLPLRYYFRYEIVNLLGRTKFKLENIYGDFQYGALNNDSKDFVIVCRR